MEVGLISLMCRCIVIRMPCAVTNRVESDCYLPTTAAVTMIVSQVASSVDHIVDKSAELCRRASLKWQSNVRRHGMPDEAVHVSPGRAYLLGSYIGSSGAPWLGPNILMRSGGMEDGRCKVIHVSGCFLRSAKPCGLTTRRGQPYGQEGVRSYTNYTSIAHPEAE